ncbi:Sodium/hydrogen exchanger family-domain-containing protein [Dichomitus squalens]|uniref:Sodium/hydrogen exchanger family-domain-containing protein n=1 Tax=Dichomitus squalens TaxID=114155 RepID=A0A4Q9MSL7_9APHY|nr:Sodium/hydrogen exchanger family-domain-containing protein [Dichomitus squalens]
MMHLDLLQITDPGLAYMILGGFTVAFSMVSLWVKEKLFVNEVVLGTACGIIFGPHGFSIFNPRSWGGDLNVITLEVMRITLAAGLFAIGVELPKSYLLDHAKSLLVMVVPTMAFGWLVVAAVIFALFPTLDFVSAMVIAACLTPTDPIISAAIVGGRYANEHVPEALRYIISAESAANDGLAYPFLSISVYLTIESSKAVAIGKWFLVGWLYQVTMGTVIGALLGMMFSKLLKMSQKHGLLDRESYVAQYLALALFTIGVTRTIGSDDLLAAFAAGSAINWDGHFRSKTQDEIFFTVIDLLLNCGCFVYIGAWMPFNMFNAPELGITPWRLVVLFVAVLILRRIPPLFMLYKWVPEIKTWREALFAGHFGPMGVGAVYVSTFAVTELPKPQSPPQGQAEILAATAQTIVAFVVLGSIIIHGLSIPFLTHGRDIGARTLTLTRTWTLRQVNAQPEWLVGIRRPSADISRTEARAADARDVEQGVGNYESTTAISDADMKSDRDSSEGGLPVPELIVVHAGDGGEKGDAATSLRSPSPIRENLNVLPGAPKVAKEGKVRAKTVNAPHDDIRPSQRGVQRPAVTASMRRREQSPARSSVRSLRFAATLEDDVAGDRQSPSGAQTPRSTYSATQGSAEGSQTPPLSRVVGILADDLASRLGNARNGATTSASPPRDRRRVDAPGAKGDVVEEDVAERLTARNPELTGTTLAAGTPTVGTRTTDTVKRLTSTAKSGE